MRVLTTTNARYALAAVISTILFCGSGAPLPAQTITIYNCPSWSKVCYEERRPVVKSQDELKREAKQAEDDFCHDYPKDCAYLRSSNRQLEKDAREPVTPQALAESKRRFKKTNREARQSLERYCRELPQFCYQARALIRQMDEEDSEK